MMQVNSFRISSRLLLCGLLPAFNVQAGGMPSMDFLEYLGGVENEVDGQLSSPVELDLEAALVASNTGKQKSNDETVVNTANDEGSVDE